MEAAYSMPSRHPLLLPLHPNPLPLPHPLLCTCLPSLQLLPLLQLLPPLRVFPLLTMLQAVRRKRRLHLASIRSA